MTCGMMSVMSASAEGETEEEYSRKVDFSGLLEGYNGYDAKNAVEGGKPITEWDCLDGPKMPEAGQVITVSSSRQEGWGAAKGALIDKYEYYNPVGDWDPPYGCAFGWMTNATVDSVDNAVDEFVILNMQKIYRIDKIFFTVMESWSNQGVPADFFFSIY